MEDGLYTTKNGKRTHYFFVEEGVLYMPLKGVSPAIWMTSGKPVVEVDNRLFMRAQYVAEELPEIAKEISDFAETRNLYM